MTNQIVGWALVVGPLLVLLYMAVMVRRDDDADDDPTTFCVFLLCLLIIAALNVHDWYLRTTGHDPWRRRTYLTGYHPHPIVIAAYSAVMVAHWHLEDCCKWVRGLNRWLAVPVGDADREIMYISQLTNNPSCW